jgi:hypothetical protein
MRTFDEEIAHRLKEAAESGELSAAKGYGKPLEADAGWEATPEALRMPMKILKDAGVAPPEIEMFRERARIKALIEATTDTGERERLRLALMDLEQKIALRLESLHLHGL